MSTLGSFPQNIKKEKVILTWKNKNHKVILLQHFKIFECAFLPKLMNFLEECNILINNQYVILQKSTSTAIFLIYKKIIEFFDKRNILLLYFVTSLRRVTA